MCDSVIKVLYISCVFTLMTTKTSLFTTPCKDDSQNYNSKYHKILCYFCITSPKAHCAAKLTLFFCDCAVLVLRTVSKSSANNHRGILFLTHLVRKHRAVKLYWVLQKYWRLFSRWCSCNSIPNVMTNIVYLCVLSLAARFLSLLWQMATL